MVDARLSEIKRGRSVVRVPFLTASLLGEPNSGIATWLEWSLVTQEIGVRFRCCSYACDLTARSAFFLDAVRTLLRWDRGFTGETLK